MNHFDPVLWHDFFVMVGSGTAALTGLVFVGLSINLEAIAEDPTHRSRAVNTLSGFTAAFILCGLLLLRGIGSVASGWIWSGMSLAPLCVYAYSLFTSYKEDGSRQGLHPLRIAGSTLCYLAQIVGGAALATQHPWGAYLAAAGLMAQFVSLMSEAWLLLIGIYDEKQGKENKK